MKRILSLIIAAFLLSACSDDASVTLYDKKIITTHIPCMKLNVWPPNKEIEDYLQTQYLFDATCTAFEMEVSTKSGIVCNSTQNIQTKALGAFPSSYLKIEIRQNAALSYSYYKDLKEDVALSDVQRAFKRVGEDLIFFSK